MLRLVGEEIELRDWRPDEADAMHRWRGDAEVMRFLSFGSETLEDSARHLRECLADQVAAERERWFLAIELAGESRVIGSAGLHYRRKDAFGGELGMGWFLEKAFWGRGLATGSARLLRDFAFEELGARKLSASCDAGNVASERVMQKIGMQKEAAFRQAHRRFGEWRTRLWYGMLREEWQASGSERAG